MLQQLEPEGKHATVTKTELQLERRSRAELHHACVRVYTPACMCGRPRVRASEEQSSSVDAPVWLVVHDITASVLFVPTRGWDHRVAAATLRPVDSAAAAPGSSSDAASIPSLLHSTLTWSAADAPLVRYNNNGRVNVDTTFYTQRRHNN